MYKLQVYTVWYVYIGQENVIRKNVPMKDTSLQSVTFKTLNCNSERIKRRKTDNDAMINVAKV